MYSVLIACKDPIEAAAIKKVVRREYAPYVIHSQDDLKDELSVCDLILVDHNFTEQNGIDFLTFVVTKTYLPVLMLTPPDDARIAVEAMECNAHNYIIKTNDYLQILNLSIKDAIGQVNERDELKKTIISLKKKIRDLEKELADLKKNHAKQAAAIPSKRKKGIFDVIISRLKTGDVNLPALPQINLQFRNLINRGANITEVANLLKQDAAISSKLIAVSNTAYYRGLKPFVSLEQAIGRLGLSTTRKFVEVISNRSLYTVRVTRCQRMLESIWEHSLASAYAAQITTEIQSLKLSGDAFTLALFHDIGKLVLLQVIGELEAKNILDNNLDDREVEAVIRTYHADFGAVLLKKWKFPIEYFTVARHHFHLTRTAPISPELLVVHFANLLVKSMGYTEESGEAAGPLEEAASTKLLKISELVLEDVKEQVANRMKETAGIFI